MLNNIEQPPIVLPKKIAGLKDEKTTLKNGIAFHTLSNSNQDVVRLSVVFRAGSSMQQVAFSASTTANLLSEGTEKFSASEIAERMDFIGSYFDVSVDRDYCVITFCTLKKFLAQTMEIAEQLLTRATFGEEELRTYCHKRKQRIAIERSKVSFKARELFASSLFGKEHPYGINSPGEKYDDLRQEDVKSFFKKHYCAENCFAVSSGDLDAESIDLMSETLEKITRSEPVKDPVFPEINNTKSAFLEHEDALQSAIRIGIPFHTRSHPDFIPMQVACTILGGYFGSRLVKKLREEKGFTYGVFSGMVNLENTGYMAIATEVAVDATQESIDIIFQQIELLRQEKVGEDELQMVKNIVIGEIMRIMDGPFGVVDITIENLQNKTNNSYLDKFIEQINALTPEKILEITTKYWQKDNFTTVIVGKK
ncbi:MAG: pitrilysin family protein [Rikenellaceae bacterium]